MAAPPLNAQNRQFREEMVRAFDVLGVDPEVRVIILTGGAAVFCSGLRPPIR
jgi:enoyl-CoA hydratase